MPQAAAPPSLPPPGNQEDREAAASGHRLGSGDPGIRVNARRPGPATPREADQPPVRPYLRVSAQTDTPSRHESRRMRVVKWQRRSQILAIHIQLICACAKSVRRSSI